MKTASIQMKDTYKPRYFKGSPLGFHGDKYLLNVVDILTTKVEIFIETGTHVGSTLHYFGERYPRIPCFGCEPYKNAFNKAKFVVQNLSNAHLFNVKSLELFTLLKSTHSEIFSKPVLCWLDAHGGPYPRELTKEVEFITEQFISGFLLIDDFKVPHNPRFQYDVHGTQRCCIGTIRSYIQNDYLLYYPNYSECTSSFHPLVGWGLIQFGNELINLEDTLKYAQLGE